MKIVLLGPPGAGKGTQAQVLSTKLNLSHISTGDILRQNVENKTPVGLEAKSYMERGELVPDELMNKIVTLRIGEADCKKGFILDGYPRTQAQAVKLDEALLELNQEIDFVFYFATSTEVIIKRLSGRRICKSCQAVYHIRNMPSKKDGICDKCGGTLYQRPDDKEETIKNRLEVYNQQTKPLIDYYQKKNKLKKVNGDLVVDELFEILAKILQESKLK